MARKKTATSPETGSKTTAETVFRLKIRLECMRAYPPEGGGGFSKYENPFVDRQRRPTKT